ncbi:MAG: type II toxin-antitoxin system VapC family toxin [Candidatus Baldrarchaeia archaeon]
MKIERKKAYIDTNIIVYAVIHHPVFGNTCAEILRDMRRGLFQAYGSIFVAIELLDALSKIDTYVAGRAINNYLAFPMEFLEMDESVIRASAIINEVTRIRYDSVHAALMLLNDIAAVITNDEDDWRKLKQNLDEVKKRFLEEGFITNVRELEVITPANYKEWRSQRE